MRGIEERSRVLRSPLDLKRIVQRRLHRGLAVLIGKYRRRPHRQRRFLSRLSSPKSGLGARKPAEAGCTVGATTTSGPTASTWSRPEFLEDDRLAGAYHRRDARGQEGLPRPHRGTSARATQSWRELCSTVCGAGWRWPCLNWSPSRRLGFCQGDRRSVVPDARPSLLGHKRGLEQAARLLQSKVSKLARPGHLDGRDRGAIHATAFRLRIETSPSTRSGGTHGWPIGSVVTYAGVLRLSRRALEAPADNQPHRKHIRHRATPYRATKGCLSNKTAARHGLQAPRGHKAVGAASTDTTSCPS